MHPLLIKRTCILLSCAVLFISLNTYSQVVTTLAGTGTAGFSGDGGQALQAELNTPVAICFDGAGNMYIAEYTNQRIRKVDGGTGIITTIAGNGTAGFSGDGGPAINAQLHTPVWVVADKNNHLFITDYNNLRVRRIDLTTGIITTVAGDGTQNYVSGQPATQTGLLPMGLAIDPSGNLFITQHSPPLVNNNSDKISRVDMTTGIITTYAGTGIMGFSGDGGIATLANLNDPYGIDFDQIGNLYFADNGNQRIRRIDAVTHKITTVAGDGVTSWYAADGGLATQSGFNWPTDVKVDSKGNLIIADMNDCRIRKVDMSTGVLTTIAGNHNANMGPDCVAPTLSSLGDSRCVAVDGHGNVCWTEQDFHRIRMVIPTTTATISITASSTDICGTQIYFTAHTTGTSLLSTFSWQKNGVKVGTNDSTYTDNFNKNDVIACTVNPNSCGGIPVSSNSITLTGRTTVTPVVTTVASNTYICAGTAVSFTASNASNSLSPSYQWMVNNVPVGTDTTVFTSNTLTDSSIVVCRMTVPQCGGGTTKAFSTPIIVRTRSIMNAQVGVLGEFTAGACLGSLVKLHGAAVNCGDHPLYQWYLNGQPTVTTEDYNSTNFSDGDVVTLAITTDSSTTCQPKQTLQSGVTTINFVPNVTPSITISSSGSEFCEGHPVQFIASTVNGGDSPNLEWQINGIATGGTDSSFSPAHIINGDLVSCLLHASGCADPKDVSSNGISMIVHPLPDIHFSPADTTVSPGTVLQLKASASSPVISYAWLPDSLFVASVGASVTTRPIINTSSYQVQATSDFGCVAMAEGIIKVMTKLYMPTAFTPNGDGKNDVFRIPQGVNIKLTEFAVFDRWGNKLFSTKDISVGWDGTLNGKTCDPGTYIYLVIGSSDKGKVMEKGTVVLIR
ncbi:MAG: gliding motility-associated C-terminal domain-containing protein [Flavisolibacter sp.]